MAMLGVDLLHVFYLGIGRDMLGSALKILCSKAVAYFAGSTIDARLESASKRLRSWAKMKGYSLCLKKLDKAKLAWSSDQYLDLKFGCFLVFLLHSTKALYITNLPPFSDVSPLPWSGIQSYDLKATILLSYVPG